MMKSLKNKASFLVAALLIAATFAGCQLSETIPGQNAENETQEGSDSSLPSPGTGPEQTTPDSGTGDSDAGSPLPPPDSADDELPAPGPVTDPPGSTSPDGRGWTLLNTSGRRLGATSIVYDGRRGVVVLFGGVDHDDGDKLINETWEYDGNTWIFRTTDGPAPRDRHAMAYDSGRGVTVLFGGVIQDYVTILDTWEWNGRTWTQRMTANHPGSVWGHSMAYDSKRQRTVLFGGAGGNNETWEYDGENWSRVATTGPVLDVDTHVMTFDSNRGVCVLLANTVPNGPSQTWEWDGVTWSLRTADIPSILVGGGHHTIAFDSDRGVCVALGNNPAAEALQTWEWDGSNWKHTAQDGDHPLNGPHGDISLAFDSQRNEMVFYGGATSRETWVLGPQ